MIARQNGAEGTVGGALGWPFGNQIMDGHPYHQPD
jgi:hypothetical protein